MQALDFDRRCRAQLEHYCAVARDTFSAEANDCETVVDLRVQTVSGAMSLTGTSPLRIVHPKSERDGALLSRWSSDCLSMVAVSLSGARDRYN